MVKAVARLCGTSLDGAQQVFDRVGDVGLVVEELYNPLPLETSLTVTSVYEELERVVRVAGTGSQDMREQLVLALLSQVTACEGKYIVRIILGTLRLGFSDMTLLDALSWMAVGSKAFREDLENAYNVLADIGKIASILKEGGIEAIRAVVITPGIPIRPAAAERLSDARAIVEKLGPCLAQPKLDGFRLQVHLNKRAGDNEPTIHFFSRNLQDMSVMFPDLVQEIAALDVVDCVMEGEAIAYDPDTGVFLPFQETVKRKRKHDVSATAQDYPLKLFIFDVLYINGESLLPLSHAERRARMLALLGQEQHRLVAAIEEYAITQPQELEELFLTTITAGLEGLVVKRPDAIYQPGKRNFNWIKLKRQETGSLEDTIDCVILGYYFGQGKRAQFGIGAFLVGIMNSDRDCFQTVAKIGTGLSDQEWRDQKEQCDRYKVAQQPDTVECERGLYPDVWVSPEIVCVIRADEITLSPMHSAGATDATPGFALRFPRIMGLRPDKSAGDATTLEEIRSLYSKQYQAKKQKKTKVQPDDENIQLSI